MKKIDTKTKKQAIALYNKVKNQTKVCKCLGICNTTVRKILKEYNINTVKVPNAVNLDIKDVVGLYKIGWSLKQIGHRYGCSSAKVCKYLKEHKVNIQDIRDKPTTRKCIVCKQIKKLEEFHKDKDSPSQRRYICKMCVKTTHHKNRKRISTKEKERRNKDSGFKILKLLRARIRRATKRLRKSNSTRELTGCSLVKLKEHLQQTAIQNGYKNFDINNYSGRKYHIDHIIPCSAFNLSCSYHQKLCFHYSNLQILTAKENLSKGEKKI